MDYSTIKPTNDRVLLRRWSPTEEGQEEGGVILRVKEALRGMAYGEVLDIGSKVYDVDKGNIVAFSGKIMETNDADYLLLKESMIDAVIK